jgi:hypothetical protein
VYWTQEGGDDDGQTVKTLEQHLNKLVDCGFELRLVNSQIEELAEVAENVAARASCESWLFE